MGCRLAKDQQTNLSIPCYNMLVLGYSQVGKTKLLSSLKGEQTQQKNTLQINSIILNKSLKLMTFQVSGKAQKTWKNYYSCCDMVMIVIDVTDQENRDSIKQKLTQIDKSIKEQAKIFIVLNKIDLLSKNGQFNDTETTKQINQFTTVLSQCIQDYVKYLKLSSLSHQVTYCHCSAQTGQGIKSLSKKLFDFIFLSKIKRLR